MFFLWNGWTIVYMHPCARVNHRSERIDGQFLKRQKHQPGRMAKVLASLQKQNQVAQNFKIQGENWLRKVLEAFLSWQKHPDRHGKEHPLPNIFCGYFYGLGAHNASHDWVNQYWLVLSVHYSPYSHGSLNWQVLSRVGWIRFECETQSQQKKIYQHACISRIT